MIIDDNYQRYFLSDKKCIAYFSHKASSKYWDDLWKNNNLENIIKNSGSSFFEKFIRKYLKERSTILEGGCGQGKIVYSLMKSGYNTIGIDFAPEIVNKINKIVPEIDIRYGDVRNLPIEDSTIDGYISGGVIEHFWDGYDEIMKEMYRVLKIDGFLFLSFPFMSTIRRIKVKRNIFPIKNSSELKGKKDIFYQFALDENIVIKHFTNNGFTLVNYEYIDGIKGFKDEIALFSNSLQKIYDGDLKINYYHLLDKFLSKFSGHVILLIFKKNKK